MMGDSEAEFGLRNESGTGRTRILCVPAFWQHAPVPCSYVQPRSQKCVSPAIARALCIGKVVCPQLLLTQPTATWGNAPQLGNRKLSVPGSTGAKCGSPVPWRPAGGPTPTQPTAPWGNRPPARQQKVECPRKHRRKMWVASPLAASG